MELGRYINMKVCAEVIIYMECAPPQLFYLLLFFGLWAMQDIL